MKQRKPTVKVKNWMKLPLTRMKLQIREYETTVQDLDFTTNPAKITNAEKKNETNIIPFTYE